MAEGDERSWAKLRTGSGGYEQWEGNCRMGLADRREITRRKCSVGQADWQSGNARLDKTRRKFSTFVRSAIVELDNREAPTFPEGNIVEVSPALVRADFSGTHKACKLHWTDSKSRAEATKTSTAG